ncbi:MAG: pilus assembly PilX N-terminal domain-containing protein [Candidatus Paceibacterota bacterium]|jgi:hypothetical protein
MIKRFFEWNKKRNSNQNRGDILVTSLVFGAIALMVVVGLINWGVYIMKSIRATVSREQAFQIAEAGADYYQWHLAQYPTDYQDGTSGSGPYSHDFFDKDGNLLGSFHLTITPPQIGSTVVKIVSEGRIASSSIARKIEKTMAIPSLARYAVVANDNMRFGEGTEVFGPIQSNGGIRFDGVAHNLVSSAMSTYRDPDTGQTEWGVYTNVGTDDPTPPTALPNRSDIFIAGRQVGVPRTDFVGLTAGLTNLQTLARAGGKEWTSSGSKGYHIILRTDGKYDIYKVNSLQASPNSTCSDGGDSQVQWGTWSIKNKNPNDSNQPNQTYIGRYNFPTNGVIFVNDHVWIDGQIDSARLTVVAGLIGNTDPTKNANITINSDLIYSSYDGTNSVGLVAQGNINVGLVSEDDIRIDAALVAEKGRVGRFFYNSSCSISGTAYWHRDSLTLYGMIATYVRYGFAYTGNSFNCGGSIGSTGSGYCIRDITYDANLLYAPPPSFPQATTQYQVISWREIK